MLKKTITYEDFNGEAITEDFFFHLNKVEIVELEVSYKDGLSVALQRIIDAEDAATLIKEFQNIIKKSYGKKSTDGRRFIKNQELIDEFQSSKAYEALFMELITDADAASAFINGIIPADLIAEAAKMAQTENKLEVIASPTASPEPEILSKKDITDMSAEEMKVLGPRLAAGEVIIGEISD